MLADAQPAALPADAFLGAYKESDAYVDCFVTRVAGEVSHGDFISAFYTTWLFKTERLILRFAASRPSTDEEAIELALGTRDRFAAWKVEQRSADQLLLCDFTGRTRSWLMTVPDPDSDPISTRLYFGSAVVPRIDSITGTPNLGAGFRALLGFHKLYSRLLLRAACANLQRN
ncbi:MAG: hypothetical protein WBP53_07955 [Dokdonella sp.]